MKPIQKSFKEWKKSDLKRYVGLIEQDNFTPLQDWLNTQITISQKEMDFLNELCLKTKRKISYWKEMDLRQKFIALLLWLVDFEDNNDEYEISSFTERPLTVTIQNALGEVTLYGIVDWVLATGFEDPEQPFFFIHEYKKEKEAANDPLSQVLAAMFVAQELNQKPPKPTLFNPNPVHFYKNTPIYGAYVMGKYWHFVALLGANYGISQPFVATKIEDLQAIFKILKAQKQMIYQYLEK